MTKNPLVLAAIGVGVGLVTLAVILLLSSGGEKDTAFQPIKPPPGEKLRLQPTAAKPAAASPADVSKKLEGKVLLAGDVVLVEALKNAIAANEKPTYKASVDVPADDNAAQAVRDEVKGWLARKMASMGFQETGDKPDVSWIVHIDPAEGGKYTVETILRSGGMERFKQKLDLPFAFSANRVDQALAPAFAPPGS